MSAGQGTAARLLAGDVDWSIQPWGAEYERWLDEDGQRIEYRDWDPARTRVVSGPYGRAIFPGKRFRDRRLARRYWLMRAGRIIEEHFVPGRWIFRVPLGA